MKFSGLSENFQLFIHSARQGRLFIYSSRAENSIFINISVHHQRRALKSRRILQLVYERLCEISNGKDATGIAILGLRLKLRLTNDRNICEFREIRSEAV